MDTIKYDFTPFAITTVAVLGIEFAAAYIPAGPLVITGGIRVLDILLIFTITHLFIDTAQIPGILPEKIQKGIYKGMIWSVGFGLIAALTGMGCFLAGLNPLSLIYISLPHRMDRLILFFIVAGVIGPFAEELFFRGVIYGYCRRYGVWTAIIVSTALFVLAHRVANGIPLPQVVGGIVFAVAYEKEKNLLVPAMIHILGNISMFFIALSYFGH